MDPYLSHESHVGTSLASQRAAALRTVEMVFGCIVLACVVAAVGVHRAGDSLGIPLSAQRPISLAFLAIAMLDLIALLGCQAWFNRPRRD